LLFFNNNAGLIQHCEVTIIIVGSSTKSICKLFFRLKFEILFYFITSAGLTIAANVAIAAGPAPLGAPRSSVINLIYSIIYM